MLFEILVRVLSDGEGGAIACSPDGANATISVQEGQKEVVALILGDTEYNIDAGDAAHQFSFQGADPHDSLVQLLAKTEGQGLAYKTLLQGHLADVSSTLSTTASLSLGQITPETYEEPTNVLRQSYQVDEGNPYLELLLFNYGRYLLWSSARGVLPANLQGVWSKGYWAPWSGDYREFFICLFFHKAVIETLRHRRQY